MRLLKIFSLYFFWYDFLVILGAYAVVQKDLVNHPALHSQPKQYLARVAFEYIAQGEEELTLKVGEMIEVSTA